MSFRYSKTSQRSVKAALSDGRHFIGFGRFSVSPLSLSVGTCFLQIELLNHRMSGQGMSEK